MVAPPVTKRGLCRCRHNIRALRARQPRRDRSNECCCSQGFAGVALRAVGAARFACPGGIALRAIPLPFAVVWVVGLCFGLAVLGLVMGLVMALACSVGWVAFRWSSLMAAMVLAFSFCCWWVRAYGRRGRCWGARSCFCSMRGRGGGSCVGRFSRGWWRVWGGCSGVPWRGEFPLTEILWG